MLTSIRIRNLKRFEDVTIELGSPVVFVGPNNSGKTTALQALALWNLGVKRWQERHGAEKAPANRPGVVVNRRDLLALPVPSARLLWRGLHTHDSERGEGGRTKSTKYVPIELTVEGVSEGKSWTCTIEFVYSNEEAFYCRLAADETGSRGPIPEPATRLQLAFLPPMSGLASNEVRLDRGAVDVRLGEGRTAEVLRNLCFLITEQDGGTERWRKLALRLHRMFGVEVEAPRYVQERGELAMVYREKGIRLDISAAGRGLQQTLLLLAYVSGNPGAALLVDEPDAHLEILRQRETYRLLSEVASEQGSQVIIASHSEVVLNEAADRDLVVAFVGRPHRIDDRGSQVLKALKEIGFEHYLLAEQRGWVLYLEGSTDLDVLLNFARRLEHPAQELLERPFVHYVGNQPQQARDHFFGLREAKPDLVGLLICDRLERALQDHDALRERAWQRREIENYLCQPETLRRFAESEAEREFPHEPLFLETERQRRLHSMDEALSVLLPEVARQSFDDPYWINVKASDDFLDRLFERYYARLGLPNLLQKNGYHLLASLVVRERIAPEVVEALDLVVEVAGRAKPTIPA